MKRHIGVPSGIFSQPHNIFLLCFISVDIDCFQSDKIMKGNLSAHVNIYVNMHIQVFCLFSIN